MRRGGVCEVLSGDGWRQHQRPLLLPKVVVGFQPCVLGIWLPDRVRSVARRKSSEDLASLDICGLPIPPIRLPILII